MSKKKRKLDDITDLYDIPAALRYKGLYKDDPDKEKMGTLDYFKERNERSQKLPEFKGAEVDRRWREEDLSLPEYSDDAIHESNFQWGVAGVDYGIVLAFIFLTSFISYLISTYLAIEMTFFTMISFIFILLAGAIPVLINKRKLRVTDGIYIVTIAFKIGLYLALIVFCVMIPFTPFADKWDLYAFTTFLISVSIFGTIFGGTFGLVFFAHISNSLGYSIICKEEDSQSMIILHEKRLST